MTTYEEALQYLDNLELFGIKLGLENITELCSLLGNPQDSYKAIHVAGTNGKGSVAAMCSSVLKEAGFKVGMYTSPHLQTFRERMQVNGRMISQQEMVEVFEEVKAATDRMKEKGVQVTYFEFTTAMAFLYFRKKRCDFAVIEVGMGGRLDATNVVKPLVSVITNIALEHTKYLGSTKEKIAAEKAGIIKEGGLCVIGEKDEKVLRQLLEICRERKAAVVELQEYTGKMPLPGEHQRRNASIAATAIKSLEVHGIKTSDAAIRKGIEEAKWPGRLEKMQENPAVILDAAHNPAGAETAAYYVKGLGKEIILVMGVSDDKDAAGIMEALAPLAKKVIVTKAKYRGMDCNALKKKAEKHCSSVETVEDVKPAVAKAVNEAKEEAVLVTGSIFVAGEARELWKKQEP